MIVRYLFDRTAAFQKRFDVRCNRIAQCCARGRGVDFNLLDLARATHRRGNGLFILDLNIRFRVCIGDDFVRIVCVAEFFLCFRVVEVFVLVSHYAQRSP